MSLSKIFSNLFLSSLGFLFVGCSSESLPVSSEGSASELHLISAQPKIKYDEPDFSELDVIGSAYALAGMNRVRFDPTNPTVLPSHREYLTQCLAIMDQAVVWRVSGCQAIEIGNPSEEGTVAAGENLVSSLNSLDVPTGLEDHSELLAECLMAYCSFFSRHTEGGSKTLGQDWKSDRDLLKASAAIRQAYDVLSKLHWRADSHIQTAYYNTHMALDPF